MSVLERIGNRADEELLAVNHQIGLALKFVWLGDRFGQQLFSVIDGARTSLATSVEEATAQGSPVFQDLSMQRIGEKELGFLVGLANKAYWSASVEVLPSGRGFLWDISCKDPSAKTLLQEYDFALPLERRNHELVAKLASDGWECRIYCEAIVPFDTQLLTDGARLRTETQVARRHDAPPVRWKIRMELCESKECG